MLQPQISNFFHIKELLICILAKVSINSRTKADFSFILFFRKKSQLLGFFVVWFLVPFLVKLKIELTPRSQSKATSCLYLSEMAAKLERVVSAKLAKQREQQ